MSVFSISVLSAFVLACASAAAPGIVLRPGDWYRGLAKPSWRPPDWLFGPVWLVLYISIAISGWLVWRQAGFEGAGLALAVYAVHLVFNAMWSVIFFGLRRPDLAFMEIVCLWVSIAATIAMFYSIDRLAAWLLIPYLLWVSFAVVLNFRIWRLNAE
jgi:tryptophan-rich sensory protein